MGDNIIKNDQRSTYVLTTQNGIVNTMMANTSVVPQQTSRPNTLLINDQRANNSLLFTPNDYNKFLLSTPEIDDRLRGYTTPDLINAFVTQSTNNEQPSPGAKILDEILATPGDNNNYHPLLPTTTSFDHVTHTIVSNTDNRKHENVSPYPMNQLNSQTLSRERSISSSMNDYDSSNSTGTLSPTQTHLHLNSVKDELQYVPSVRAGPHNGQELVRKEKNVKEIDKQHKNVVQ